MPQGLQTADDVLFNSLYGLRTIELNRPGKLNALNGAMIEQITLRLQVPSPPLSSPSRLLTAPRNGRSRSWQTSW